MHRVSISGSRDSHRTLADRGCKVLEYLSKKGYNRTEAMLRMESANQDVDGRPIQTRVEESGGVKYGKAFGNSTNLDD